MGGAGDNKAAAPWMPSPDEIGEWLGEFERATIWETERGETALDKGTWNVIGAIVVAALIVGTMVRCGGTCLVLVVLLLCLPGAAEVLKQKASARSERKAICRADAQRVSVRTQTGTRDALWTDLLCVEHHGDDAILYFTVDRQLRLPRHKQFEPVLDVARRIATLRAEHDEALLERMERGLSRPEADDRADRGLSVVE